MKKAFLKVKNSELFIIAQRGILRENKGGGKETGKERISTLLVNENKTKNDHPLSPGEALLSSQE